MANVHVEGIEAKWKFVSNSGEERCEVLKSDASERFEEYSKSGEGAHLD